MRRFGKFDIKFKRQRTGKLLRFVFCPATQNTKHSSPIYVASRSRQECHAKANTDERGLVHRQSISEIVSSVENPALIRDLLRSLAPIHLSRGVKVEHAAHMGKALIWTIQKVLDEDFNAEVGNVSLSRCLEKSTIFRRHASAHVLVNALYSCVFVSCVNLYSLFDKLALRPAAMCFCLPHARIWKFLPFPVRAIHGDAYIQKYVHADAMSFNHIQTSAYLYIHVCLGRAVLWLPRFVACLAHQELPTCVGHETRILPKHTPNSSAIVPGR